MTLSRGKAQPADPLYDLSPHTPQILAPPSLTPSQPPFHPVRWALRLQHLHCRSLSFYSSAHSPAPSFPVRWPHFTVASSHPSPFEPRAYKRLSQAPKRPTMKSNHIQTGFWTRLQPHPIHIVVSTTTLDSHRTADKTRHNGSLLVPPNSSTGTQSHKPRISTAAYNPMMAAMKDQHDCCIGRMSLRDQAKPKERVYLFTSCIESTPYTSCVSTSHTGLETETAYPRGTRTGAKQRGRQCWRARRTQTHASSTEAYDKQPYHSI